MGQHGSNGRQYLEGPASGSYLLHTAHKKRMDDSIEFGTDVMSLLKDLSGTLRIIGFKGQGEGR